MTMFAEKFALKVVVDGHAKTNTTNPKLFYAPAGKWTEQETAFRMELAPGVYAVVPKDAIKKMELE